METEIVLLLDGNFAILPDTSVMISLIEEAMRSRHLQAAILETEDFCVFASSIIGWYRREKPRLMDLKAFNKYLDKQNKLVDYLETPEPGEEWKSGGSDEDVQDL